MQDQVGQMITAGIEAVELIIEHQGKPHERIPYFTIFFTHGAERPENSVQRFDGFYVEVFDDVNTVINVNKVELIHLPVNGKRNNRQKDINDKRFIFFMDV